jgi:hypothetical protein
MRTTPVGDRATTHGHGGLEHEPLPPELEVGPVHDDDGPQVSEQQRPSDRGIDGVALAVQVLVAQQTIHSLDLVLLLRRAVQTAAKMRQQKFAACQQRSNHASERRCPCGMPDHGSVFQPL